MESMTWMPEWYTGHMRGTGHMPGMESEEFRIDPAGGLPVGFWLVLPLSLPMSLLFTKKRDQIENLEMIERQDQVIKTYQIAKMIISGTAFESLQLTVLQTSITEKRLHFVCIYEYIVMRCNKSR